METRNNVGMRFGSDNSAGVSAPVMEAILAANHGHQPSYGADELTLRLEARLADLFEHEVSLFLVTTGTAANALSMAALAPAWGAVLCHEHSHMMVDECGAPEFHAGAKLVGLSGVGAKVTPDGVTEALADFAEGFVHQVQPAALSITQATEAGTVYRPDEIAALAEACRPRGLRLHMDGARFANAIASLGAAPAEITWRAGVTALSLGATKNGAMLAEAVVLFDTELARNFGYLRKRAGQLVSKQRFMAAQFLAWLENDHWLVLARHANAMATRLADALALSGAARLAFRPEANEVFAILPVAADARLRAAGAAYYPWAASMLAPDARPGDCEVLVRLVTSFATTPEEVDRFAALAAAPV
ncbi:MAG: low specificity L-threonine aldolase [Hyphomicrobiales bacterium]